MAAVVALRDARPLARLRKALAALPGAGEALQRLGEVDAALELAAALAQSRVADGAAA
jgi:hypothetical protein